MKRGIGVIVNPFSRQNKRNPERINKLAYIVGSKGTLAATRNLTELEQVAQEFKRQGIEILALSGGDGTNHITLTKFIEVYGDTPLPKIALLRGGTMNTIADSIGVKGDSNQILFNIVEKYHNNIPFKTVKRNVMNIDGRYGFLFANGVAFNFLKEYYSGSTPTPVKAAAILARAVASAMRGGDFAKWLFRKFNAKITVDGCEWPHREYFMIVAATIDNLGFKFNPFVKVFDKPNCFNIVGVLCEAIGVAVSLPAIRLGLPLNKEKYIDAAAEEVIFESEEPMKYTIDGDIYESGEKMIIRVGPKLELIVN
ncbi:MAG: diacylglycerol kinase family protein [Deltaproteobacteria bacterium]|nr:diacylglycerol kinase family protein [Deltaproteobacteria bacterium]